MRNWIIALVLALCSNLILAAEAPSVAADPVLEKRMMKIAEELRCLVCQNQNVADSHAELAIDFKNEIRRMLKEGQSDEQIRAFMVQRYGDFVLYNPPMKSSTWLLWLAPFVLMLGGLFLLMKRLRQRSVLAAQTNNLTEAQHQRALDLLEGHAAKSGQSAKEKK